MSQLATLIAVVAGMIILCLLNSYTLLQYRLLLIQFADAQPQRMCITDSSERLEVNLPAAQSLTYLAELNNFEMLR